jgi:PAS domain-containing protein
MRGKADLPTVKAKYACMPVLYGEIAMYPHPKIPERIQITQRQAALFVLALYFVSAVLVTSIALMTHASDNAFVLPGAISGSVLFWGAWILYYKTNWEPIRYFAALASSLLVGLFLPEPFVTSYAPMVVVIPAVLALLLTEPFWVIVNSLLTLAILLIRAGGSGVYAHPATLVFYAMIVGALVVSRLIEETSLYRLKQAEEAILQSERQMSALVSSLDDIVFQFDAQGTYLNVWTANENLLVQPRDELLGRHIEEVLGDGLGRFGEWRQAVSLKALNTIWM